MFQTLVIRASLPVNVLRLDKICCNYTTLLKRITLRQLPTKLPNSVWFSDTVTNITGTGWTLRLHSWQIPTCQFSLWVLLPKRKPTPANWRTLWVKSAPDRTHHTKTNIVVVVVIARIVVVVVARRGTAVIRIVVPGTAPQSGEAYPFSTPSTNWEK